MLKFLSSFLGTKSPAFIWLVTQGQGRFAGQDTQGNRYYTGKARHGYKQQRRWVIYKDAPEPSSVPPEWHGWLHHQTDIVPEGAQQQSYRKSWQKQHRPNLTGTAGAWNPQSLVSGVRPKGTGDYQAWTPDTEKETSR